MILFSVTNPWLHPDAGNKFDGLPRPEFLRTGGVLPLTPVQEHGCTVPLSSANLPPANPASGIPF